MYRRLIMLTALALASLAGCAPSLESKLVGRWKVDMEGVDFQKIAAEQVDAEGEGMAALAAGMLESMMKNMNVQTEFRPDHSLQTTMVMSMFGQTQEKTQSGTWKVQSAGSNTLAVAVTLDDGKTNTMNIKFLDDNTFTAAAPLPAGGEQEVTFRRIPDAGGA